MQSRQTLAGWTGRKGLQRLQQGDEEEEETHVKQLPTTIHQEETHKILCPCEGRKDMWLLVTISTPEPLFRRGAALMSAGEQGSGGCPRLATSISEVLPHICKSGQSDAILLSKKAAIQNSWEKAACLRRVATKWAGCQANQGILSPTQSCQGPVLSWVEPPLAGKLLQHSRHSPRLLLPSSLPAGTSPW